MSKNRLAAFLGIATYCNGILNYSVNFFQRKSEK
jgi:hypothetical protein